MKNIKLILEYDGGRYNGWQRQIKIKSTVQGRIEYVLGLMTGEEIELTGAGRTDAGVHALGQVANFKTKTELSVKEMKNYLLQYLPDDINLVHIEETTLDFHSRFNAKGKKYLYQIWNSPEKNVFERRYYYQIRQPLSIEAMEEAKAYFIGEIDFRNFTAVKMKNKSTVRRIDNIEIVREGEKLTLVFTGEGFLHKMVRIITGTIIEAGLGEIQPADIERMFASHSRKTSGFTAPPHALFLAEVYY